LLAAGSTLVLLAPCQAQQSTANQAASPATTAAEKQPAAPKAVPADQIVAVVNSDIITRNELRDRTQMIERALEKQGTQLPTPDVLEKQVLERMILEKSRSRTLPTTE